MKKPSILAIFAYRNGSLMGVPYESYMRPLRESLHDFDVLQSAFKDLIFIISDNKLNVVEPFCDRDLLEYDMVYFRIWQNYPQQAKALAHYLQCHNRKFISKHPTRVAISSKLAEYAILADQQVPIIDSICTSSKQYIKMYKSTPPIDFPILLKPIDGARGDDTFVIHTSAELREVLADHPHITFILQRFVPNTYDYRILIFGGEVKLVLKRTRTDGFVNNTSQGAQAELVNIDQLDTQIISDSIRAAELLQRDDFCGVDVIVETGTNKHYILEVNRTPQIETGGVAESKLEVFSQYIRELVNREDTQ